MLCDAHLSEAEPDTWWCLIFCTSSSKFGVRLWAEEILRIEWRCWSVRWLLSDVFFSFIKELFTQVCAAKHRECLSCLDAQLWHCVRYEMYKLSSIIALELNQLHLEVWWCAFHVNCKRIAEQFKPAFLGFKVSKSALEVSSKYVEFIGKLCACRDR